MDNGNTRILVAEDEPANLRLVLRMLASDGKWDVETAANGQELLDAWRKGRHPVVLSDINMPEKDGIAACQEIRRLAPEVTIIMMTGSPGSADRAAEAGLGECLQKPFSAEELVARLRQTLGDHNQNRRNPRPPGTAMQKPGTPREVES